MSFKGISMSDHHTDQPILLEAANLKKTYGKIRALDGVTLQVKAGELLVIAGPNGAGKTTLLEICEGIRKADSGTVKLFGLAPGELECRRRMGVQMEESSFHRHIKIKEILSLFTALYQKPHPAKAVVEGLGLHSRWNDKFGSLSKGWKQRVSIAIALLHEPDIILLDEVSSGLDPEIKHVVWTLLLQQVNRGAAVILSSHSMEEAERLAHRIIILARGQVVKEASPIHLLDTFPSRAKVEVLGHLEESIPDVTDRSYLNGRTVLYTDEPDRVLNWVRQSTSYGQASAGQLNLEDLYLYYVRQGG